ncbi:MAG: deoxyhypusine synthase [Candidatus Wildermuthbacteria bacterium RIFCSPHIGHO2_01_FULL_47_27]|uniref:Deoxyhypusine synthase n=1 Tax=Candidatus Wildermuthbacteria bacterium RIFCSPHIGHO2_02_FULL_47_17 TaxID=1802452 RepID=A0A1G2R271_9BACT|nr:MAG: deoxyhypusine synthase [Candidatus Wildermuthbacteria bacterium RIFCSPHIGHO2_01_FULL_47_27]OHA66930.1 MAG: deoxyhypusine synthase [Candidatus Wildermuthbacteria bacterium RIFCSPHIGHO2_02_FULL_47_17]OHA74765.1 MAG: deoxyhypusine synthase [Candidatus Wildermuthbacteria bacterium RIFCSPLOWO2_02_FULL_47_10]
MKKNPYKKEKVRAIEVGQKPISKLLDEMADTGFQGRRLGEVAQVWERMIRDPKITILLGYAGSLSTTGQWKLINWLIENRYIDVLVSTGANISEDIIEAMGFSYWKGSPNVDDVKLLKNDVNRYYDVFGSEVDYMEMTELIAKFMVENLKEGYGYSSRELLYLFGKWLWKKDIRSIVATAAQYGVPVFCPAIVDSPYGDGGLIAKSKGFSLVLDNMKDYVEFMGLAPKIKDTGVVYIGGGVPKDFIQLLAVTSNLLYPSRQVPGKKPKVFRAERGKKKELIESYYPHKYAIQITTDVPHWGGLSGCTFEEATSWGKEDVKALKAQCFCDATIALPIVTHALQERVKAKRKGTDFSSAFEKI